MFNKTWGFTLLKGILGALFFFGLQPDALSAQDCGSSCGYCGPGKREGYTYTVNGDYNMDCLTATTGCKKCGGAQTMVADAQPAPAALIRAIRTAPIGSLRQLTPELTARLLVHPARGMIAIRGEGCEAGSVVAVSFLERRRIELLARGGVVSLESFLSSSAPTR